MEGERRKRKIEDNEEEENEEEKMEKFFSLIKRTKDVRDRLYNKEKSDDKKVDGALAMSTIWNPTFKPEDFIDSCGDIAKTNNIHHDAGPSEKHQFIIEKKQDLQEATPSTQDNEENDKASEHHLDLNLSL